MTKYHTKTIKFNDLDIFHISKPRLKHSYISISSKGIELRTPNVSSVYIDDLLRNKEVWIRKKLLELEDRQILDKNIPDTTLAKVYMKERLDFFANQMNLKYNELKFRKMKGRWGSCSSKKNITLNLYLYNISKELIDYVIVHELAHLKHMNHSSKFHECVRSYMPDSKELEKKLKKFNLS